MGYRQGAFALGYVGDQTDPLAALRGRADKVLTVGQFAETSDNYREFASTSQPTDRSKLDSAADRRDSLT